jgi:hypothetical protein
VEAGVELQDVVGAGPPVVRRRVVDVEVCELQLDGRAGRVGGQGVQDLRLARRACVAAVPRVGRGMHDHSARRPQVTTGSRPHSSKCTLRVLNPRRLFSPA